MIDYFVGLGIVLGIFLGSYIVVWFFSWYHSMFWKITNIICNKFKWKIPNDLIIYAFGPYFAILVVLSFTILPVVFGYAVTHPIIGN